MTLRSNTLLEELEEYTFQLSGKAKGLQNYPIQSLTFKPAPEKWNILECLAHLNLYGKFYLAEIAQRIKHSSYGEEAIFHSRWLGNYFANSMLPKKKLNKMKTFKNMNPLNTALDKGVITIFLDQQEQMMTLLREARKVSLNKTKISITITSLIKLKLGDAFRLVIYHNQRHFAQIENLLKAQENKFGHKSQASEYELRNF